MCPSQMWKPNGQHDGVRRGVLGGDSVTRLYHRDRRGSYSRAPKNPLTPSTQCGHRGKNQLETRKQVLRRLRSSQPSIWPPSLQVQKATSAVHKLRRPWGLLQQSARTEAVLKLHFSKYMINTNFQSYSRLSDTPAPNSLLL